MHLMAALTMLSLLALFFGVAAYLAISQHPNQPSSRQRYPVYRNYRSWPDKPARPRKLSFEEKIWQRAKLDRQLKKQSNNYS